MTEAALEDLRPLLEDLRRKGNRHDDLYRTAGELIERSEGPAGELDMVRLHLAFQRLKRLHARSAGRAEPFDGETLSTMEAVFDVLPGVTLADEGVRVLIERQEAERAGGLTPERAGAAGPVLEAVRTEDAPFAPEVKAVAEAALAPGAEDRLAATKGILARNVVMSVLRFVAQAGAGGVVGNFAHNNGAELIAYAATMGGEALLWAQSVLAKHEQLLVLARDLSNAPPPGPRPPRRGGR